MPLRRLRSLRSLSTRRGGMARPVDLSHTIEDGTITCPGLPGPVIADQPTRDEAEAAEESFELSRFAVALRTNVR